MYPHIQDCDINLEPVYENLERCDLDKLTYRAILKVRLNNFNQK